MPAIKLEAFRALQCAIEAGVPELNGAVCPWPTPPNHKICYPSLAIVPVRFKYFPDQASPTKYDPGPDKVIMNVGRHEGLVQLRVAHATPTQRMELEQSVLDLFLGTPMHPGVLLTNVLNTKCYGEFLAAWELDGDEWENEKAFDNEFWSVITVVAQIPALVVRGGAYRIRDLRLGLTGDFKTQFTPTTFDTKADVVRINADGTLTPL